MGDNTEDTHIKENSEGAPLDVDGSTDFKKPIALPKWRETTDASGGSEQENLDVTASSETSNSSVCTVIYNGQPISSKPPTVPKPPPLLKPRNKGTSDSSKLRESKDKYKSASSLDSGIDPGESDRALHHSPSVGSMKSVDSGCDMEVDYDSSSSGRATCATEDVGSVSAFSRNVARTQSFRASKEGAEPVLLMKSESVSGSKGNNTSEPRLTMPVSAEMHHMLSRVGVVGEQNINRTPAPFVALQHQEEGSADLDENHVVRESILNLKEAAVVSSSVKKISSKL